MTEKKNAHPPSWNDYFGNSKYPEFCFSQVFNSQSSLSNSHFKASSPILSGKETQNFEESQLIDSSLGIHSQENEFIDYFSQHSQCESFQFKKKLRMNDSQFSSEFDSGNKKNEIQNSSKFHPALDNNFSTKEENSTAFFSKSDDTAVPNKSNSKITLSSLSLEKYAEIFTSLVKESTENKVQPFSVLDELKYRLKDIQQVLLLHRLLSGSRTKKEILERMIGMELISPFVSTVSKHSAKKSTGNKTSMVDLPSLDVNEVNEHLSVLEWIEKPIIGLTVANTVNSVHPERRPETLESNDRENLTDSKAINSVNVSPNQTISNNFELNKNVVFKADEIVKKIRHYLPVEREKMDKKRVNASMMEKENVRRNENEKRNRNENENENDEHDDDLNVFGTQFSAVDGCDKNTFSQFLEYDMEVRQSQMELNMNESFAKVKRFCEENMEEKSKTCARTHLLYDKKMKMFIRFGYGSHKPSGLEEEIDIDENIDIDIDDDVDYVDKDLKERNSKSVEVNTSKNEEKEKIYEDMGANHIKNESKTLSNHNSNFNMNAQLILEKRATVVSEPNLNVTSKPEPEPEPERLNQKNLSNKPEAGFNPEPKPSLVMEQKSHEHDMCLISEPRPSLVQNSNNYEPKLACNSETIPVHMNQIKTLNQTKSHTQNQTKSQNPNQEISELNVCHSVNSITETSLSRSGTDLHTIIEHKPDASFGSNLTYSALKIENKKNKKSIFGKIYKRAKKLSKTILIPNQTIVNLFEEKEKKMIICILLNKHEKKHSINGKKLSLKPGLHIGEIIQNLKCINDGGDGGYDGDDGACVAGDGGDGGDDGDDGDDGACVAGDGGDGDDGGDGGYDKNCIISNQESRNLFTVRFARKKKHELNETKLKNSNSYFDIKMNLEKEFKVNGLSDFIQMAKMKNEKIGKYWMLLTNQHFHPIQKSNSNLNSNSNEVKDETKNQEINVKEKIIVMNSSIIHKQHVDNVNICIMDSSVLKNHTVKRENYHLSSSFSVTPQSPTASPPLNPLPTPTPTSTPIPFPIPTPVSVSFPTPTPSPVPFSAPVPTSIPTPVSVSFRTLTPTPAPLPFSAPVPASIPVPVPFPTPTPVSLPFSAPVPTSIPTPVSVPFPTPTPTPAPLPFSAPVPTSILTPVSASFPTPTPTPTHVPFSAPVPTIPTPVPVPFPTPTPVSLPFSALVPTSIPTSVPVPFPTPTPAPLSAPTPVLTSTSTLVPFPIPIRTPSLSSSHVPISIPTRTPTPMPTNDATTCITSMYTPCTICNGSCIDNRSASTYHSNASSTLLTTASLPLSSDTTLSLPSPPLFPSHPIQKNTPRLEMIRESISNNKHFNLMNSPFAMGILSSNELQFRNKKEEEVDKKKKVIQDKEKKKEEKEEKEKEMDQEKVVVVVEKEKKEIEMKFSSEHMNLANFSETKSNQIPKDESCPLIECSIHPSMHQSTEEIIDVDVEGEEEDMVDIKVMDNEDGNHCMNDVDADSFHIDPTCIHGVVEKNKVIEHPFLTSFHLGSGKNGSEKDGVEGDGKDGGEKGNDFEKEEDRKEKDRNEETEGCGCLNLTKRRNVRKRKVNFDSLTQSMQLDSETSKKEESNKKPKKIQIKSKTKSKRKCTSCKNKKKLINEKEDNGVKKYPLNNSNYDNKNNKKEDENNHENKIKKDDVVWVYLGSVCWPAQVKEILDDQNNASETKTHNKNSQNNSKLKKMNSSSIMRVRLFGNYEQTMTFSLKKTLPFAQHLQRINLKKHSKLFREAVDEAMAACGLKASSALKGDDAHKDDDAGDGEGDCHEDHGEDAAHKGNCTRSSRRRRRRRRGV